ncbi:splicing factor 1 isoform X1 [Strongylocentrotus purpuratus]|uniref:Splicing factor 1 n=1 Tax=Strongylocentrotus purpuratus TaxID=7668 RepID=A0A7M7ST81_STRPU|nr:splicing factor 1 isoform X1 [Strongylocentrotus purpuratus]
MAGTGANSVPLGALHPCLRGGARVGVKSSGNDSMLNAAREAAARVTANILKRDHGGMTARPQQAQAPPGPVTAAHHPLPGQRQTIEPLMQTSTSWPMQQQQQQAVDSKRRKRSRWGGEDAKAAPGVATVIPSGLSKEQETQVLLHLQIEELSRKLRTGELGVPPNVEDRSPSPEPIYNHEGKRLNTREYRMRKKLEEDRHKMIQDAITMNPEYKPPADYKPPVQRVSDRVMIPQDQHPDINFVGLLIGPRGNTLKKLEKDTTTKIMIRGKGSVKEGKVGRKDGQPLPGEDEPLHALVTANNAESVKKAVIQIQEIIKQGIETPEGQNDLRRMQLRELARLNGTLRDEDMLRCSNCGSTEHRTWQCTEKQNVTNNILCSLCGSAGHIAADCREKATGDRGPMSQPIVNSADKAKMDSEYLSLMAELGEGPLPGGGGGGPPKGSLGGHGGGGGGGPPPRHSAPPMSSAPPPNRPFMMPPGGPGGQGNNFDHPPPLMGQHLNVPWNNRNQNKPQSLLNSGHSQQRPPLGQGPPPPLPHQGGPPPPSNNGPPPPHHNQPPFMGGPPRPPRMNRPPPVGPPGGMPPNMMPPHMGQGPPGPPQSGGFNPMMPPPPRGGGQLPPWAYHGGPPASGPPNPPAPAPAPVPPPSLLVAPPPPPPSSEPPPQPPTSAPWQISSSSRGVASSPPSQPPWQTQAILQQALALSQPQQAAAATTSETTTSTTKPAPAVPWQQLAAAAAAANAPPASSASSTSPALPPWLQAYTAAAAAAGGGGASSSTAGGQPTPPHWAQAMPPPPPQPVPPPSMPGMPPMGVSRPHMQPPMPPMPYQQGGMPDVAPPPPPHLNAPPPPPPPSS